MGKKNSVLNKPLGSVGDNALGKNNFITRAANAGLSYGLTGGIGGEAGLINTSKAAVRNLGEGLGEITGSNALRKQAMDQQSQAEAEAKRQADMSDALARNAGGDPTNIFLASGKRKKSGAGGSTGSSGTGNSRTTGVQS